MSTIKAANVQNTGSGAPTFKNSSGTEVGQLCRAWVSFNGTGTVAIKDSFNVSSITDIDTGRYAMNFSTAMANANYCFAGNTSSDGDSGNETILSAHGGTAPTASAFTMRTTKTINGDYTNKNIVTVSIFSD